MRQRRLVYSSLGLLVACSLVSIAFNDSIGNDAAGYYVPQAERFADGTYEYAFNPRTPPLVPVLAGIVTKCLHVTGFTGLKIVTAVFMGLGMIPLYSLTRRLMPKEQAIWVCVLYAVCAQVVRFGITAQLTSAKFCLLLWLVERCITVSQRLTIKGAASLGVSVALSALCRTEGIFYLALVSVAMVCATSRLRTSGWVRIGKTLAAWAVLVGTCLVIWAPWFAYEFKQTGYLVLDSKQIGVVEKCRPLAVRVLSLQVDQPKGEHDVPRMLLYPQTLQTKLAETIDGLYVPYLPLVLIGLMAMRKQKGRGHIEAWLVGAALFNVVVIWGAATQGPPVLKRYIFPSAIFLMPYAAVGWGKICHWLKDTKSERIRFGVTALAVVVGAVSLANGMKQVTDSFRGKYRTEEAGGRWIKAHAEELDVNITPSDASWTAARTHWAGRSLVVASAFPQIPCWAQAQFLRIDRRTKKTMEQLVDFMRAFGTDVLVVEKHVRRSTDSFDPDHASLKRLDVPGIGPDVQIYQFLAPKSAGEYQ